MLFGTQNPHSQRRSHAASGAKWGTKASGCQCAVKNVRSRPLSANTKVLLVVGFLASLNLAVWGAKTFLSGVFEPVLKGLGQ